MRTFVMGDIHGAHKALLQCLERAGFDTDHDQLIQLGDIVDGYPQVYECFETLLSIRNKILIRGNHDDWFQSFFETGYHPAQWQYGGKGTVISYLKHAGKPAQLSAAGQGFKPALSPSDIPHSHRQLIESQKPYYIDSAARCFVHGGFDRHVPFALQKPDVFYWDRRLFEDALQRAGYYEGGAIPEGFYTDPPFSEIYIGHSPTIRWEQDDPITALNITNLDTGAGHKGRLTIMELPSTTKPGTSAAGNNQFWQSDPLPQLYTYTSR